MVADEPTALQLAVALDGVRNGAGYKARCPAHDDAEPSLSIVEKDGRTLFTCRAGCDQQTVLAALRAKGLWPRPAGKAGSKKRNRRLAEVATYNYVDERGGLLFQVVRYERKVFRQRRPDGNGGWEPSVQGVRTVPYQLPGVLEAIGGERPVFIVEGEKDVDTLAGLGLTATCNARGAGKWTGAHAAFLKDADAIILPDNDEAGREHANKVATSLAGTAKRVRIVELPDLPQKGDVTDWVGGGGTAERLRVLVERALDWRPDAPRSPPEGQQKRQASADAPDHWNVKPWPQPVSGAELLDDLVAVFRRYMVLPINGAEALALWVLHAWAIGSFDVSPLLTIVSPTKQCGKTTLLTMLHWLTPRSVMASNISPAALFRFVEEQSPTLLIDEADAFMRESETLRGLLNSGHTRPGAQVIRCEGTELRTRSFSTWCPKVVATIGTLAETLMDRSIIVTMRRKAKGEQVERFRLRDNEEFSQLRRRALRWTEDAQTLRSADPDVPDDLDNRPADNWRPLLAISDAAGADWPARAREAARALSGAASDDDLSVGVELLQDIREVFRENGAEWLAPQALVEKLNALPEAPWGEFQGGRPLSTRKLAQMLKPFGIKSGGLRSMNSKDRGARKYVRDRFEEAWNSYLPPLSGSTSGEAGKYL